MTAIHKAVALATVFAATVTNASCYGDINACGDDPSGDSLPKRAVAMLQRTRDVSMLQQTGDRYDYRRRRRTSLAPTASPTAEPTVAPTASPTLEPTVAPTASPTAEPTSSPTAVPTSAGEYREGRVNAHGNHTPTFMNDCEPCVIAEKYAISNTTECEEKHKVALKNALAMEAALGELDECNQMKNVAEKATGDAKIKFSTSLVEATTAVSQDQSSAAKGLKLCDLIDAWIAAEEARVSCDDKLQTYNQSQGTYNGSVLGLEDCDKAAEKAQQEAVVACAELQSDSA